MSAICPVLSYPLVSASYSGTRRKKRRVGGDSRTNVCTAVMSGRTQLTGFMIHLSIVMQFKVDDL